MNKFLVISFFILTIANSAYPQNDSSFENIFNAVIAKKSLNLNPSATEKFKLPLFDSYELRTETDDFDFENQEYLLRINPVTPKIKKAIKGLYNHYSANQSNLETKYLQDQLEDLYDNLYRLYRIDNTLIFINQYETILSDKEKILVKKIEYGDADFDNYLNTVSDLNDLKLERFESLKMREELTAIYDIEENINWISIISIDEILINLDEVVVLNSQYEFDFEKEGIEKEIALENQESNQLIDFGQIRYQGPHSDLLEERIQIGVGLQLNTSSSRKLKIQKLKMEIDELEWENRLEKIEAEQNTKLLKDKIRNQILYYKEFESIKSQEIDKAQEVLNLIIKREDVDPLKLIKLEESKLLINKKIKSLQEDILKNYIDYLKASGKMFQSYDVNKLVSN